MGADVFDAFQQSIIDAVEENKQSRTNKVKTESTQPQFGPEVLDEASSETSDEIADGIVDEVVDEASDDEVPDEAINEESAETAETPSVNNHSPKEQVTHQGKLIVD